MLVCLSCGEVFDATVMKHAGADELWCPKKSCQQELVDVDECLIPIIIELNGRGYHTKGCCSGHFWENQLEGTFPAETSIMFDESVRPEDLINLPIGFVIDQKNQYGVTIRKRYNAIDPLDIHIEVLKTSIALTEWVRALEPIDFEEELKRRGIDMETLPKNSKESATCESSVKENPLQ